MFFSSFVATSRVLGFSLSVFSLARPCQCHGVDQERLKGRSYSWIEHDENHERPDWKGHCPIGPVIGILNDDWSCRSRQTPTKSTWSTDAIARVTVQPPQGQCSKWEIRSDGRIHWPDRLVHGSDGVSCGYVRRSTRHATDSISVDSMNNNSCSQFVPAWDDCNRRRSPLYRQKPTVQTESDT